MAREVYCWACNETITGAYENALVIEFSSHLRERHDEAADMTDIRRWIRTHGSRAEGSEPTLVAARVIAGAVAALFAVIGLDTGGIAWFGIAGLACALVLMTFSLESR